jgi:hypothetical protein
MVTQDDFLTFLVLSYICIGLYFATNVAEIDDISDAELLFLLVAWTLAWPIIIIISAAKKAK